MTPFNRFALVVLVSMLVGAGIGAAVVKRLQPPTAVLAPPVGPSELAADIPAATYTPVELDALPGWTTDAVAQALPALQRSCVRFMKRPPEEIIGPGAIARPGKAWQHACQSLAQLTEGDAALRAALARDFTAYRVGSSQTQSGAEDRGTFTGYYEADLNGSLTRTGNYQVPIYAKPRNLVTVDLKDFLAPSVQLPAGVPASLVGRVVPAATPDGQGAPRGGQVRPYYTRSEIDSEGAIAEDADVLLWADDPVAVHILHIQGSGRVTLPDGQLLRIGFAGHNGRVFKGIGSILLEAGELKPGEASMIGVRAWLALHPAEATAYMNRNTRYIFFRRLDPAETDDGPIGALGVSLTPLRSMAVDPRSIPLGAPVWLNTADPDGVSLQRLMVAQDVGAAITGAVRGDIFWGHGEAAFLKAGRMKSPGSYFVFVPRALGPPAAAAN